MLDPEFEQGGVCDADLTPEERAGVICSKIHVWLNKCDSTTQERIDVLQDIESSVRGQLNRLYRERS